MRFLRDNAEYWRSRAEETRTMADAVSDPEAKRILLGIADGYDWLAGKRRRAWRRPRSVKPRRA